MNRFDTIRCAVKVKLDFVLNKKKTNLRDKIKSERKHTEHWELGKQVKAGDDGKLLADTYRKEVRDRVYVVHVVDPYIFSTSEDRNSIVEFCRDFRHKIAIDSLEVLEQVAVSPDAGRIGSLLQDRQEHVSGVQAIVDKYPWLVT